MRTERERLINTSKKMQSL